MVSMTVAGGPLRAVPIARAQRPLHCLLRVPRVAVLRFLFVLVVAPLRAEKGFAQ